MVTILKSLKEFNANDDSTTHLYTAPESVKNEINKSTRILHSFLPLLTAGVFHKYEKGLCKKLASTII